MKYIIATLILCFCLQLDAFAQKHKRTRHYRSHHRSYRAHRTPHKRVFYNTHNVKPKPAPSPYRGDNTPINDGQRKNVQRNINYNSGQSLPSNSGR